LHREDGAGLEPVREGGQAMPLQVTSLQVTSLQVNAQQAFALRKTLKALACAVIAVCAVTVAPINARAAWPERTVTLVVPYSAGGVTDVLARLTAERLQAALKQTVIVQNDVGAGGIIGTANVAHAKPDGYTLFFGPIALLTLSPLTTKVNYNPDKDFEPVSVVASTAFVVTVNEAFPAKTLAEFIAEVKKKPGGYSYASAGGGSITQVASLLFLKSAGLQMTHVPYRGVGPAFTDLIAGNVQMLSATPVELTPYAGSKKVRPLGISSKQRSRHLPDVPTISETVPSPFVATYNGILAPRGTPREVVDRISKAVIAAVKTPEFSDRLFKIGVEGVGSTPEEMVKTIEADRKSWLMVKDDIAPK
jgi:tripartite-type tricarboxylate transporter receptor subunit TctC